MLFSGKIVVSRHVTFDENHFDFATLTSSTTASSPSITWCTPPEEPSDTSNGSGTPTSPYQSIGTSAEQNNKEKNEVTDLGEAKIQCKALRCPRVMRGVVRGGAAVVACSARGSGRETSRWWGTPSQRTWSYGGNCYLRQRSDQDEDGLHKVSIKEAYLERIENSTLEPRNTLTWKIHLLPRTLGKGNDAAKRKERNEKDRWNKVCHLLDNLNLDLSMKSI